MRRLALLAAVGTLMLAPGSISAQIVPDSLIGHRVRVVLVRQTGSTDGRGSRQAVHGTLLRLSTDSVEVHLHPHTAPLAIAADGIQLMEASRGVSRTRSALVQGALGAATWASLGGVRYGDSGGGNNEDVLIWAAGGFAAGAIFGALFPEERWRRVFRR